MNYEKMWEELKEIIESIKTSKMNGIITGCMVQLQSTMKELEKKESAE